MIVKAFSRNEARLLVKQIYGYTEDQFGLTVVQKPTNVLWGLMKRKGIYMVTIKNFPENVSEKKQLPEHHNGFVEIKNGILTVSNPKEDGRYPSISIDDPNIDVFVNDKQVEKAIILTEQDNVKFIPKTIEPITKITIELSEDKMQATLKIHKEKGKSFFVKDANRDVNIRICSGYKEIAPPNVTFEECIQTLTDANIVFESIDIEAINRLVSLPMGGSAVVARGKKPIEGVKAEIKYYFNKTEEYDADEIPVVQIGDVLAAKIMPALPGRPGISVTGEVVNPIEVKDEILKAGQGAIALDNGQKVVALLSGRPVIRNNTISVIPLIVISSDVSRDTGNIEFDGDIIIKGNIMDNMKVTAKGKIKVLGSVFNAQVISNNDIKIFGKVIGGTVIAGANMTGHFCIVPLIKSITTIIDGLIQHIEARRKDGLPVVSPTMYYKKDEVKDLLGKIEQTLPLMENDDTDAVSDLLEKIKSSILNANHLPINDTSQTRDLYKELVEYIELIRDVYVHDANVTVQYAQNANIQSSGTIVITGEGSYQSSLIAKEAILYKRASSIVKGGRLITGKRIKAGTIGSPTGIRTYCRVLSENGKVNAYCYNGTIISIGDNIVSAPLNSPTDGIV